MTNNEATQATPTWDMKVAIRTGRKIIASDLSLTEATEYISTYTGPKIAVVLPNGDLINAGRPFHMFVRTVMGAKARMGF